jgi:hypothetical protein
MEANTLHPLNAEAAILVTPFAIVADNNALHPLNAELSIVLRVLGIVTASKLLESAN